MLLQIHHIVRPIVLFVLALYSVSVVVCLDAECLCWGKNDGCGSLLTALAAPSCRFDSDADSHCSPSDDSSLVSRNHPQSNDRNHNDHNDHHTAHHHCSCVCHVPALIVEFSLPLVIAHSWCCFSVLIDCTLPIFASSLYRPPQTGLVLSC
jgi:hypothetical protein